MLGAGNRAAIRGPGCKSRRCPWARLCRLPGSPRWQHQPRRESHALLAPNTAHAPSQHISLPPFTPQKPCGGLPGWVQVLLPAPPSDPQPELRSLTPSFGPRVLGPSLSHSTNLPWPIFSEAGPVWEQGSPGESDTTPRKDPRGWGAGMAFRAGLGRVWDKDLPEGRGFQVEKLSRGPECAPPPGSFRAQLSQACDQAARPAGPGHVGGLALPPVPVAPVEGRWPSRAICPPHARF